MVTGLLGAAWLSVALASTAGVVQTPGPPAGPRPVRSPAVVVHAVLGAPSPDSLAKVVMGRFASGTVEAFDSVYVDPLGRAVLESAARRQAPRTIGLTRVLWVGGDRAVLLLTGTVHSGKGHGLKTG